MTLRPDRPRSVIRMPPVSGDETRFSMSAANLDAFFSEMTATLGADGVNRSDETIRRYGENTMPGGDRPPAGVVYPGSTGEVEASVRAANRHRVPLYPISTGNNIGLGSRSAFAAGQGVWGPGRGMDLILGAREERALA